MDGARIICWRRERNVLVVRRGASASGALKVLAGGRGKLIRSSTPHEVPTRLGRELCKYMGDARGTCTPPELSAESKAEDSTAVEVPQPTTTTSEVLAVFPSLAATPVLLQKYGGNAIHRVRTIKNSSGGVT